MTNDTGEAEAKHEKVLRCLDSYIEQLKRSKPAEANEAAATLAEMDCSVCSSFGHHLGGIAVGMATATREPPVEALKTIGLKEARHIRDQVSESGGRL